MKIYTICFLKIYHLSFREKMRKQHTKELRKRIEKEGYDTSKISNEDIFLIGLELAK